MDGKWRVQNGKKSANLLQDKLKDREFREFWGKRAQSNLVLWVGSDEQKKRLADIHKDAIRAWTGQHHTPENRELFRELRTGEGNPMFGMKWMYNEDKRLSQRVPLGAIEGFISQGWILGRKIRFTPVESKKCTGECGKVLPASGFNKCGTGLQGRCRACDKIYHKQWKIQNPNKIPKSSREPRP